MSTINLGEVPVCSEATLLPVVATVSGTWAFMTTFNGAYQYVQFSAGAGEKIVVPASLNENYTYTFKLYQPDNAVFNNTEYTAKTIPLLPGIDYVCPAVNDDGSGFAAGKLQFIATEGQVNTTHIELADAKQIALFVEGVMWMEGPDEDNYTFDKLNASVAFGAPLTEGQKITIIYFK